MTTFVPKAAVPQPQGKGIISFSHTNVPRHIAIIMDGNGRWANAHGLPRSAGHQAGETALMDTIAGAIEAGVTHLSVYAFSTENWKRSPSEVRFLMGYSREVLRRRRDELNKWGVRIRWSGRTPRLWRSVIKELQEAEALTRHNREFTLVMCVNYGGRAELADAMERIGERIEAGELKAKAITEQTIARHLYIPDLPEVDLLIRTSGEQRISNFLLWQCAYSELMYVPEPWPEFDRHTLWRCIENYGARDRRFGGAVDTVATATSDT
ncbi:MAG: isoprenyl transferase [Actinomycetaceae bacterium]|nr:isoprenyl transferase [Actinomycetaceae bacterium]